MSLHNETTIEHERIVAAQGSAMLPERTLPMMDTPALRAALEEAEPHTLLMTYVHLTHDEATLDRFAEHIRSPYAYPPEAIPADLLADLRAKTLAVLTTPGAAKLAAPAAELMRKMMSVGVAEDVAIEFWPLLLDQVGFGVDAPRKARAGRRMPDPDFKVLVIGAGMTGIAAGVKLDEAGYDYTIIEKNPEVGGTWWENTYPGVGVDTPSHFYSFSFAISPEWNNYHPKGRDMFEYMTRVTDYYNLRPRIQLNTTVVALRWDSAQMVWQVTLRAEDGSERIVTANAVINGHGPANRFRWPAIEGLESFAGPRMHTATWNPDVDLKGKRVAVIGTGASAAQLIPSIADDVAQLTVFQRTKHWVISNPAFDDVVSDGVKFAMRHIPHYIEWFRFRVYWFAADGLYPNVLMDPDWPKDSPAVSATNEAMWKFSMAYLEKSFADRPDLLAAMTPDFPVFSKRIIMDRGDYFATYKRPHVRLDQGKIARVVPGGIEMADGTVHAFDVLICATGFDVANMMGNLEITGIDGRRLRDEWGTEDPRAYFGMMVPGYPNYFHTVGPNSAPNHAAGQNLISERQVNWIIECLDHITAKDAKALMPSERAYLDWNARVEDQMTRMIWSHPKANSYYNNSKKRNYLSWPWRLVDLWEQSRHPRAEDFELLSD